MRIFVGISEIAGYHAALAGELRRRGHTVAYASVMPNAFGYADPENSGFPRRMTSLCAWLAGIRDRSFCHKLFWRAGQEAARLVLLLWAVVKMDYFIFGFGTSFLPRNLDLPLLKLLGKKVLFVFHGSDSRPSYMDYGGVFGRGGAPHHAAELARLTKERKAAVGRIDRYADWVIDNPFSSHFHRRPVLNWYVIGVPCAVMAEAPPEPEGDIVILHAPSAPVVKGSAKIEAAVKRAAARVEGLRFETIIGRPHAEVLRALRTCHFGIDQLYSDTPCAGFVAEAAACGRPAIVCGYGWSEEWLRISGLEEWPSVVCREEELEEVILAMAGDAALRRRTVEAARRRAKAWSRERVAERFECILSGKAPAEWYSDPKDIPVFYSGGGLPEETVAAAVKTLLDEYGTPALLLEDKPRLEELARELARNGCQTPRVVPGSGMPAATGLSGSDGRCVQTAT
jgi:glycosyltransferase involved in cell wall biosynthesis